MYKKFGTLDFSFPGLLKTAFCIEIKKNSPNALWLVAPKSPRLVHIKVISPKFGDSLVVTIPSRAKVEMVRKTNSLSGVRITDTIARGKVIGVNEGVVTVKPMVSRTNVAKLQSLASTNTMVGVNAIENKMKTFG